MIIKNSIKAFFKTNYSKYIIILLFFNALISLGTFKETDDLFTSLTLSYSNAFFISYFMFIIFINTIYLYNTFFKNKNYIIRTNNKESYSEYFTIINIIISFIYSLILLLFTIIFIIIRIKGNISFSNLMYYNFYNWGYFIYFFIKNFILIFMLVNISKYLLLLFNGYISIIYILSLIITLIFSNIVIEINSVSSINLLPTSYLSLHNYGTFLVEISYIIGEFAILYVICLILNKIFIKFRKNYI